MVEKLEYLAWTECSTIAIWRSSAYSVPILRCRKKLTIRETIMNLWKQTFETCESHSSHLALGSSCEIL